MYLQQYNGTGRHHGMEDERHPEQTPSLDPRSVEIARLLKQVQEHQTEIAQWKSKTAQLEKKAAKFETKTAKLETKTDQLEKKTAKLEEELAQALKKTSRAGGRNQDEATLTQGSPQKNPPPQKQRRGSVVENLAGE